jgi:outer membrane protein OmpA-like peptidoglycan-associated protein
MKLRTLTGMSIALALCACASTPRSNAALETARAAVQTAEADPNVNKYAALDLAVAKKDLDIAETAALQHHDDAVDQPAYLATQMARMAQVRGAAKADDAKVAAGQIERDRIQLNARTREVDRAKAETADANAAAASANAASANANLAAADANAAAASAIGQRDQAADQAARLQAELDQLKATPTPRGLVLTLGDVLFDTGRAEMKSGAVRRIDQLAQFLNEHPDRLVQIDGFTDSIGSDSYNQDLSQRRAESVKSALLSRNVDASRIGTQGYGKAFPVANNTDSGGRQLNRRVEVVIGSTGGSRISPRG